MTAALQAGFVQKENFNRGVSIRAPGYGATTTTQIRTYFGYRGRHGIRFTV